jgi:hypothetical protein
MAMTMMPRIGFSSSRVAYQQLVPDADTVAQWKSLVLCCRHPLVRQNGQAVPGEEAIAWATRRLGLLAMATTWRWWNEVWG